MANKNNYMCNAKSEVHDEFYTQYETIETELQYYKSALKNKIVYCNCDDYRISNFVKYFKNNFNKLGLKQFVATGYNKDGHGTYYMQYIGVNGSLVFQCGQLEGNGSFDSPECLNIFNTADIIITNPPFSRFKDIIQLLFDNNKQFLLIGNQNALTLKNVFPKIIEGKVWWSKGESLHGGIGYFINGGNYINTSESEDKQFIRISQMRWWTNIEMTEYCPHKLEWKLTKTLADGDYIKYDNFDAINCDRTLNIPIDYNGMIGVPITYYEKHDPSKYKIIGLMGFTGKYGLPQPKINGQHKYKRLVIQKC